MRRLVVFLALISGCRCLEPVFEGLDAGEDRDAGYDAGAPPPRDGGCNTSADCTGPRPGSSLCAFTARDAGFSCIDHTCIFDCVPDRACTTAFDAGCLDCTGAARHCATDTSCNFTQAGVIEATNGCPGALGELTLTPLTNACGWAVTETSTGRVVGTVYRLDDFTYLAHLPELGGTCTGFSLATQVERWLLSCPACQLELRL